MTRTFLVAVNADSVSPEELALLSLEIQDACLDKGIDVTSVKPWEAPTQPMPQGYLAPPQSPT